MKSATFATYLSTLKASGVVEETVDGFRAVDGPSVSLTREQMQQLWESALRAGARDMLRTVMSVYPEAVTTSTLKTSVRSMTATTFATYLSTLRSCGLITVSDDRARAADWLFN